MQTPRLFTVALVFSPRPVVSSCLLGPSVLQFAEAFKKVDIFVPLFTFSWTSSGLTTADPPTQFLICLSKLYWQPENFVMDYLTLTLKSLPVMIECLFELDAVRRRLLSLWHQVNVCPYSWITVHVCSILVSGGPSEPNNHRPIYLSSVFSNAMTIVAQCLNFNSVYGIRLIKINEYRPSIGTGMTSTRTTQWKITRSSQQMGNKFEFYLDLMLLYAKWELPRLVDYISSIRFQGKFGLHARLSPQFSLTGCPSKLVQSCAELYHVTCM